MAEEDMKKPKKPFYSLAGIAIGQFREAQKLRDDMPSFFPNYFTSFWSLYRTPVMSFKAEIRYVPTCEGCLTCTKPIEVTQTMLPDLNIAEKSSGPSIWSRIFAVFRTQPVHGTISSFFIFETILNGIINLDFSLKFFSSISRN